jgi:hypothetical protein
MELAFSVIRPAGSSQFYRLFSNFYFFDTIGETAEHWLKVYENRVLRKMSELKRNEIREV